MLRHLTWIASICVLASCTGTREKAPAKQAELVKITQFYANKSGVPKGEAALLCYGVANAKTVRLDPEVEKIVPSLSRCIEVAPKQDTTYTLTAVGADGTEVSQKVTVSTRAARPRFADVSINKERIKPGEEITICFKAQNATSARITGRGKSVTQPGSGGCWTDKPLANTTYTVRIEGASGESDEASANVMVAK